MPHEPCKISVQKFRSPGGSADILEKRMGGINPIHLHWRWQTPRWVFKQPSPSCGREGGGQNDQSLLTQNIRGIERRGKSLQLLSMSTFKSMFCHFSLSSILRSSEVIKCQVKSHISSEMCHYLWNYYGEEDAETLYSPWTALSLNFVRGSLNFN